MLSADMQYYNSVARTISLIPLKILVQLYGINVQYNAFLQNFTVQNKEDRGGVSRNPGVSRSAGIL